MLVTEADSHNTAKQNQEQTQLILEDAQRQLEVRQTRVMLLECGVFDMIWPFCEFALL